jgi:Male sterility protein
MNDRLAGLSPQEKRALLVQTLRRKSGALDKLLDRVAVNVEDLEAEAVLDPEIQPNDSSATTGPERVLLTGATGFLGSFLLSELLRRTRTSTAWCAQPMPKGAAKGFGGCSRLTRCGTKSCRPGSSLSWGIYPSRS